MRNTLAGGQYEDAVKCTVDKCERDSRSKIGLCGLHYKRWKRWGDPLSMPASRIDYEAMFWNKVDKNSGVFAVVNGTVSECWLWTGCKNENGYGQLTVKNKRRKAHRWIYERINGPIPEGFEPDHLCRHRSCVRPDHMEPVTRSENIKRGSLKDVLRVRAEQITQIGRAHV